MRTILAIATMAVAGSLNATPIYVDFTVRQSVPFGDTRPGVYSGTWSFDDSLVRPGSIIEDVYPGRRLDSFSFSWLGEQWNPVNSRLARIEFDRDGNLRSWIIGATAASGTCGGLLDCVGIPAGAADFYLAATRLSPDIPPPELVAVGVQAGREEFAEAQGSFTVRELQVPTPSSLPLLGSALIALAVLRRRVQRASQSVLNA